MLDKTSNLTLGILHNFFWHLIDQTINLQDIDSFISDGNTLISVKPCIQFSVFAQVDRGTFH